MSRVAHVAQRRFWRRQGGPRAASPQHSGGAGSAPRPASPTRACYIYGVAGAPGSCGVPRRRRGCGATHGRHLVCCPDLWEGLPAPPQPRAMVRNSCLLPPAAYRQTNAIAGVWFAADGRADRCRRSVAWYEFWRAARSRCPHLSIKIGLIVTNSRRNRTITDQ